jgi:hypothetical protein
MTPNNALILAIIVGAIYIMVLFDRIKTPGKPSRKTYVSIPLC